MVTEKVKKKTPSEVATVAVECMADADVDGFMDLMASTARFENNEETISEDGQTAKVKIKMVYGDGEDETQTMHLVKEDDEWKIEFR